MSSVISGDANVSATEFGYLDGVTAALQTQLDGKAPSASPTFTGTVALPSTTTLGGSTLTSGKILQIVRATDSTDRTTTSTTFVDASISVTITPKYETSAILIVWTAFISGAQFTTNNIRTSGQITDNSNNAISGAEESRNGVIASAIGGQIYSMDGLCLIGYATPATTSVVTYKGRFRSFDANATTTLVNTITTGQMYAIEVSA